MAAQAVAAAKAAVEAASAAGSGDGDLPCISPVSALYLPYISPRQVVVTAICDGVAAPGMVRVRVRVRLTLTLTRLTL